MLQRFTTERQRAAKGSLFNLDDEDELTHYGQSLSKLDDFDDAGIVLDDDDDDGGWCLKIFDSIILNFLQESSMQIQ
jgi:nucleolar protein 14